MFLAATRSTYSGSSHFIHPTSFFHKGPGQSYAAATGLYYKVLSAFASFALSTIFCGLGGSLYIGAGSMKYIQVARTSNSITAATVREFCLGHHRLF